jgi:hypothetical protein
MYRYMATQPSTNAKASLDHAGAPPNGIDQKGDAAEEHERDVDIGSTLVEPPNHADTRAAEQPRR